MTNHDGSGDAPGQANHKYHKLIDNYKSKLNQYGKKKITFEELKEAETKLCDYYTDNGKSLRFYEKIFKEKLIWPMDIIESQNPHTKIVLTGGPSSGKSCLVYALEFKGYNTINEVAQKLISAEQARGILEPWKDSKFETKIYNKQISLEEIYENKPVFLDRSVIDTYVYAHALEQIIPEELQEFIDLEKKRKIKTYEFVFYLEPLNSYGKENYSRENKKEAKEIGKRVRDFYFYLGYDVISVPNMMLDERLEFILDICKEEIK